MVEALACVMVKINDFINLLSSKRQTGNKLFTLCNVDMFVTSFFTSV